MVLQLENTEHVYGVAVYTGMDSKMSMNSKLGTNKVSLDNMMVAFGGRKGGCMRGCEIDSPFLLNCFE